MGGVFAQCENNQDFSQGVNLKKKKANYRSNSLFFIRASHA